MERTVRRRSALFDKHVRLFEGFVYERDAYDKRPGCDPELICHGLEPFTEIERRGMERLTPIDVELLTHKLSAIVEEARDVYMSLSISEGIITGDMNCGLFTASGDPVTVGTGIYFHTLLNNAQLKYINKYYRDDPTVGLSDGDIYFFNDELSGGVHCMDMFTAMPIFWNGELVAWAECGGHQGETGSITPGGFAPTAKSRYDEGLHIPCMRIGENFVLRRDILDFMTGAVRNGFVFEADLRSRVATMLLIRNRFLRELERKGVDYVLGGMRQILVDGERNARTRLREINDGIFRSVLFNDDHGTFFGLTRVPLTLIKEGDELAVLIQGVSPECSSGPFNSSWHLTRAATAVYLFSYFFRGYLPANAGLLEPVSYYVEGPSLMNSSAELAHGLANQVCAFATQNLYMAGAKMLYSSPHRTAVQAPQSRHYSLPIFAGVNRRGYLSMNYTGAANAGGGGARYDMDGENALGFYWGPWTDAGEIEEQDDRMPQLALARQLDTNFHGYGKYRGGTPLLEVSVFQGHHECSMSSWGSCDKITMNFGLFGGYAGPPNPRFVIRDTDLLEQIRAGKDLNLGQYALLTERGLKGEYILSSSSKDTEVFHDGDVVVASVGAGGGYGDVLDREPALVLRDLHEKLITKDVAEKIYGVALDPETQLVDEAETERLRSAIRKTRLELGRPFDAFIADWLCQKPDPEILEHYGASYPEPQVPGYAKPFWGLYD
jgi:N-methylhydantoinase B/oxoprolinase/acetone carboxylase alpha subunit